MRRDNALIADKCGTTLASELYDHTAAIGFTNDVRYLLDQEAAGLRLLAPSSPAALGSLRTDRWAPAFSLGG